MITKRLIDLMVPFFRRHAMQNRLYQHTDFSDRFDLTQVQVPCVIVRTVSNNQRRIAPDDFIDDVHEKVQLVPIQADNNLVGNNVHKVNLPSSIDYDPKYPWDNTIGVATGTDIVKTIFTTGTSADFESGTNTGIIINVPPPTTFEPTSLLYARECPILEGTPPVVAPTGGTGTYTIAVALNSTQDQFYLVFSGNDISGTRILPVEPNQFIINGSGIAPELTGTAFKMNDILWAGDQYQIRIFDTDQFVYAKYGGIYNHTISFECYARSTIEAQELGDLVEKFLVEKKKEPYDSDGFVLTEWSQGGQSERDYINEHLFQTAVSCQGFVQWGELRSVDIISSASGIAIPIGGVEGVPYFGPGVETLTKFNNPTYEGGLTVYPPVTGT